MYTNKDGVSVSGPDSEGFSPTESYRRAVRTLFSEMGNNKEMIFYVWIMLPEPCSTTVCRIDPVIRLIIEVVACWEQPKNGRCLFHVKRRISYFRL